LKGGQQRLRKKNWEEVVAGCAGRRVGKKGKHPKLTPRKTAIERIRNETLGTNAVEKKGKQRKLISGKGGG